MQITFDVCNTSITAHQFEVQVDYDPEHIAYYDENLLASVTYSDLGAGIHRLSGYATVPAASEEGASSCVTLIITFARKAAWPQELDKSFKVRLIDPECDPQLVEEESYDLSTPHFYDLRSTPTTHLSTLLITHEIELTPSGSLPDLLIDDELVIDLPFTKAIGTTNDYKTITLMPGAQITVASQGPPDLLSPNFVAQYTTFQTCPDQALAEGIVVQPNLSGGAQIKLNMDHCRVMDCRHGVSVLPNAWLLLTNTEFTNNYVGLHLDMTGAPAGQEKVTFLGFSGNTFATGPGQALKAAYPGMPEAIEERGYCGIFLKNYRDFNVFGANSFERLANGIVAANSNLNVGNLTFGDMRHSGVVNAYPREGFGIHLSARNNSSWANIGLPWAPMSFDDCKTGVYAERYAGKVEHCTMTDVKTGVDWQKSQLRDVRLRQNDITAFEYGIRSFLNEPTHNVSAIQTNEVTVKDQGDGVEPVTGIQLNEMTGGSIGSGWTVTTNSVTMQDGGWGILYRTGNYGTIGGNYIMNDDPENGSFIGLKIEGSANSGISANTIDGGDAGGISTSIFSSSGWANTFQCNCVDNTAIGAQFLDLADFTNAVRGNHFYHHCYGLQVGAEGVDDAYVGLQEYQGNLWELSQIECTYGAKNYCDATNSQFIVNGAANPKCNPPVTPTSGWFFNQTKSGNYEGCDECDFPGAPGRVPETASPTELDDAIVHDSMPYTTDEMIWKGRYRLYRKILRWPTLESVSPYGAFKTAQSNLSTGKLAYIAEQRAKLFVPDSLQQVSINGYRTTFLQKTEDIRVQDSLRQAGASINETNFATLVSQRNTAAGQLEAIYYTLDTARANKIAALATLNSSITTSYACDANHKSVNAIVFHLLLTDTLATGDLATLEGIAAQCPLEGGDAVYEARAIVRQLTGTEYDDLDLCNTSSRPATRQNKQTAAETGEFYPNPTTGELRWNKVVTGEVRVEVYDQLGRLQINFETTEQFINLRSLPDGIYWLRLFSSTGESISQKVILLKG